MPNPNHANNDEPPSHAHLPAPGCRYTILQVRDLGERPDRLHPIYRLEIEGMQRCQDGTPESNRTIGLELVPDMGDWVPWKVIP